jgi:hypothetical protein
VKADFISPKLSAAAVLALKPPSPLVLALPIKTTPNAANIEMMIDEIMIKIIKILKPPMNNRKNDQQSLKKEKIRKNPALNHFLKSCFSF